MLATKDIAAVSTMMPPFEETEAFLADWRVADRRAGVRLPMRAAWRTSDGGEAFGRDGY